MSESSTIFWISAADLRVLCWTWIAGAVIGYTIGHLVGTVLEMRSRLQGMKERDHA